MIEKKGTVIFDFDLTLIPEESTVAVLKRAIKGNHHYENLLTEITSNKKQKKIIYPLWKLYIYQRLIYKIDKNSVDNYISELSQNILPEVADIIQLLKSRSIDVKILSCGYGDWIIPICKAWGISSENIITNKLVWFNNRAIAVSPSKLNTSDGKKKVIMDWYKKGNLKSPVLLVGDGKQEQNAFRSGLGDAFIQANYFISHKPSIPKGNAVRVDDIKDLSTAIQNILNQSL